jgi:hypothetical protein
LTVEDAIQCYEFNIAGDWEEGLVLFRAAAAECHCLARRHGLAKPEAFANARQALLANDNAEVLAPI